MVSNCRYGEYAQQSFFIPLLHIESSFRTILSSLPTNQQYTPLRPHSKACSVGVSAIRHIHKQSFQKISSSALEYSVPVLSCLANSLQFLFIMAAFKPLIKFFFSIINTKLQPGTQRINSRRANTVKTAGHLISAAAEFTAGKIVYQRLSPPKFLL